jgi:hypothetical protein
MSSSYTVEIHQRSIPRLGHLGVASSLAIGLALSETGFWGVIL